jgi:large subunit ribosomal protein L5
MFLLNIYMTGNYYYKLIIKQDLINKFLYKNIKTIPKLKTINLSFGHEMKNFNLKEMAITMLSLELISGQKGKLAHLKNTTKAGAKKIRRGYPVGCKITLQKKSMYSFFFNLLASVLPKIKNFSGIETTKKNRQLIKNAISFNLNSAFVFDELDKNHNLFKNLPLLNIALVTNTKTNKEMFYLFVALKLPLIGSIKNAI